MLNGECWVVRSYRSSSIAFLEAPLGVWYGDVGSVYAGWSGSKEFLEDAASGVDSVSVELPQQAPIKRCCNSLNDTIDSRWFEIHATHVP